MGMAVIDFRVRENGSKITTMKRMKGSNDK